MPSLRRPNSHIPLKPYIQASRGSFVMCQSNPSPGVFCGLCLSPASHRVRRLVSNAAPTRTRPTCDGLVPPRRCARASAQQEGRSPRRRPTAALRRFCCTPLTHRGVPGSQGRSVERASSQSRNPRIRRPGPRLQPPVPVAVVPTRQVWAPLLSLSPARPPCLPLQHPPEPPLTQEPQEVVVRLLFVQLKKRQAGRSLHSGREKPPFRRE